MSVKVAQDPEPDMLPMSTISDMQLGAVVPLAHVPHVTWKRRMAIVPVLPAGIIGPAPA